MVDYEQDVGPMDLVMVVRVLRALDDKYREAVVGLTASKVVLRFKNQEKCDAWVRAWKELTD